MSASIDVILRGAAAEEGALLIDGEHAAHFTTMRSWYRYGTTSDERTVTGLTNKVRVRSSRPTRDRWASTRAARTTRAKPCPP
jgi:hypothetical protein